ncbi:hypothetical protein W97_08984 [Coniosporium apollinis CBS 100218]|uniref:Uncharacterized protein n=1 Tax=Coniosporium apollinis (strain CBS 100218) TaxID=1168221 RepID=R7Z6J4_CONA1|nr:uncharacterized protein W97_08984 [Coniosporium apollinis CBS 100218]EON69723.1 hypothetical protein W97_08984 [Coniosporium apollinis CBS 100218]
MTSTAVNRPTDTKVKERDINNKLQLYGIFTAFSNGKIPSNKQIDVAINSALASRGLSSPSKKLSPEGQKLVGDLRDAIEQAKILLLTKNDGNLLQDFIWQTQHMSGGNAQKPGAPIDRGTAQQHGNEALDGLRTLGTLILSNGQFRKLLNDASILIRDMAGDAAQNAAQRVQPSEDELNQIDRPADDNEWHDVPDMSRDKLRQQAKSKFNQQKPFSRGDMQEALGDATQAAHPSGSRDPADAANKGIKSGVDNLKSKMDQNVPQETKEKTRHYNEKTRNYLKEKLPEERRKQAVYRLKKMVVEIQGHEDYLRAVDTLLRLAEEYTGHTKSMAQQGTGAVKGAHADDSLKTAEADLKTLIERFANYTSMDDLFDSINAVYRDADRDPELKGWFKHLNRYVRKCLKEQGYIMQDSATEEWNEIYDQGHFLLRDRYRNHTDRIVDEIKFFAKQFDEDSQNKAFAESMNKLFMDLGNDENGKPTFKPHLLKDLRDVVVPAIFENIRYVPIPRIEYSDPMIDAVVENLVIEGDNLAPNVVEFGSDNYWRWGRKKVASKSKNKVMLSVSGVQMDLKDVSYYVRKKQGFPSVTDKGVCDIFMGGQGFSFKVEMENADATDRTHFFKVNRVAVDVKNLNVKMKQSNHKLLFNIFKPLLFKVVRPAIQKVLEKQIKDNINQLDGIMYKVHSEAKRAEAEAKRNPDPQNIQNIYQRYLTAAQKEFMKGKQKKDEVAADKKVNMAVTQHDSIFKDIQLPGGISTKATEYKDLARKGDRWESPVFSIGSAGPTSNLPKVSQVQRKPHNVTEGGVRGSSGARDYADDETNYGKAGSQGYGGQGYDNTGSTGYGSSGYDTANTGYGSTNGTAQFSNQVSSAFDGTNDYSLGKGGMNGAVEPQLITPTQHTTLGTHNPVLTGTV